jgi:hypothetical protein
MLDAASRIARHIGGIFAISVALNIEQEKR